MSYLAAFIIGAVLGIIQFAVRIARHRISGDYPFQAFAVMALIGGGVYGTVIWLLAKLF